MTFVRAILAISLPFLVAAAPYAGGQPSNNCNTGPVQCCNSVQSADSPTVQTLLGLLGIAVSSVTGQVGVTCSPITVIGGALGSSCAAQPVCCSNNNFNGVVAIGCTPIAL